VAQEDGVLLCSIDDAELENARRALTEVFGEENFVACLVWEKSRKNDAKFFSVGHEYVLVFAKSIDELKSAGIVWREQKPGAKEIWDHYLSLRQRHGSSDRKIEADLQVWFQSLPKTHPSRKWARYRRVDANGPWRDDNISWPGGDGPTYDLLHPKTGKACKVPDRGWVYATQETMLAKVALGIVEFRDDHTEPPIRKSHLRPIPDELLDVIDDEEETEVPDDDVELATQVRGSYFYKQSQVTAKYHRKLLGGKLFDNPKDHEEIRRLIEYVMGLGTNDIVLDFFSGSGSTAEAVYQLNAASGTEHRFILCQLPEPCNPAEKSGKAALKAGLATIADITKERVRRVIKKLDVEDAGKLDLDGKAKQDRGFRVFKLAESNLLGWDGSASKDAAALEKQLEMHIDYLRQGRTDQDLLYELLLKSGYKLTDKVVAKTLAGKTVYDIADGGLMICLDRALTLELIRAMADEKPTNVVCLDAGFDKNDQLKANAVLTFKSKGVTSFRTV
jgi:adenine-specific DNA-methyltransferase